jgi:hypothetical protein
MAQEDLEKPFAVPTRDKVARDYRRDYALRVPEVDVSDGSKVDAEARTFADNVMPIYSDAIKVADGINEDAATGTRLDRAGERIGVKRPKAHGAGGYVAVTAAPGGGAILTGDKLRNRQTRMLYEAAEDKLSIQNGEHIRVRGVDKGPASNVKAGTVLHWENPRAGIGQNATVVAQSDGSGLTGGANTAEDSQYLPIIKDRRQNPPSADNEAAVRDSVRRTPDAPIEAVFTYPTPFGPGTLGFTFTISPEAIGASRMPDAFLPAALAQVMSEFNSDGYFAIDIAEDPKTVIYKVDWDLSVLGWTDAVAWPPHYATTPPGGTPGGIIVNTVTSAQAFTLRTNNNNYTDVVQPSGTQTLGFWDPDAVIDDGNGNKRRGTFRKKICTITGTGPWTVTANSLAGDDRDFAPSVGQRVSPWSDSLVDLVSPTLKYFAGFGPGELFAALPADGRRHRRHPRPPKQWPNAISTDLIAPLTQLGSVANIVLQEGNGETTLTGDLEIVRVNLIVLSDLAVFRLI